MQHLIKGGADGRRIGLLGGSFNPPHEGHVHAANVALERLGLHEIWWLVSPQNPLKAPSCRPDYAERLAQSRAIVDHPRIKVCDIEQRLHSRYSIDTVRALQTRFPRTRFVWIMGADNLLGFDKWRAWDEIMRRIPVAVIARPGYHLRAASSKAAQRYKTSRVDSFDARALPDLKPPAWTILFDRLHPLSSTQIRKSRYDE